MKPRATLDNVARRCGVSGKTVSRVVNGEPNVSARVREAVERAIAELDYRPNIAARSLASTKSFVIGVLSPRLESAYYRRHHAQILGACRERGYHMVIEQLELDETYMAQVRKFVTEMRFDGLLLAPGVSDAADVIEFLKTTGIRSVAISPRAGSDAELIVGADEQQGEIELADKLWSLGHRRYAIAKPPAFWRFTRGEAFAHRLIELGSDPEAIVELPFDWNVPGLEGGRRMAIDMLDQVNRPTALFAISDELAAGAIGLCLTRGLNIPDDISIAGFDDDELAKAVWPALTTIRLPLETIIDNAMALLVGNERTTIAANVISPVSLIMRNSIGPVLRHERFIAPIVR